MNRLAAEFAALPLVRRGEFLGDPNVETPCERTPLSTARQVCAMELDRVRIALVRR
jgi:hypothetical protein